MFKSNYHISVFFEAYIIWATETVINLKPKSTVSSYNLSHRATDTCTKEIRCPVCTFFEHRRCYVGGYKFRNTNTKYYEALFWYLCPEAKIRPQKHTTINDFLRRAQEHTDYFSNKQLKTLSSAIATSRNIARPNLYHARSRELRYTRLSQRCGCSLLEYEAVTIGKKLPKFRSNLLPPPSGSLLGLTGSWLINIPLQLCKQRTRCNKFRLLVFLNQLYMFRTTNSPIFRSTF